MIRWIFAVFVVCSVYPFTSQAENIFNSLLAKNTYIKLLNLKAMSPSDIRSRMSIRANSAPPEDWHDAISHFSLSELAEIIRADYKGITGIGHVGDMIVKTLVNEDRLREVALIMNYLRLNPFIETYSEEHSYRPSHIGHMAYSCLSRLPLSQKEEVIAELEKISESPRSKVYLTAVKLRHKYFENNDKEPPLKLKTLGNSEASIHLTDPDQAERIEASGVTVEEARIRYERDLLEQVINQDAELMEFKRNQVENFRMVTERQLNGSGVDYGVKYIMTARANPSSSVIIFYSESDKVGVAAILDPAMNIAEALLRIESQLSAKGYNFKNFEVNFVPGGLQSSRPIFWFLQRWVAINGFQKDEVGVYKFSGGARINNLILDLESGELFQDIGDSNERLESVIPEMNIQEAHSPSGPIKKHELGVHAEFIERVKMTYVILPEEMPSSILSEWDKEIQTQSDATEFRIYVPSIQAIKDPRKVKRLLIEGLAEFPSKRSEVFTIFRELDAEVIAGILNLPFKDGRLKAAIVKHLSRSDMQKWLQVVNASMNFDLEGREGRTALDLVPYLQDKSMIKHTIEGCHAFSFDRSVRVSGTKMVSNLGAFLEEFESQIGDFQFTDGGTLGAEEKHGLGVIRTENISEQTLNKIQMMDPYSGYIISSSVFEGAQPQGMSIDSNDIIIVLEDAYQLRHVGHFSLTDPKVLEKVSHFISNTILVLNSGKDELQEMHGEESESIIQKALTEATEEMEEDWRAQFMVFGDMDPNEEIIYKKIRGLVLAQDNTRQTHRGVLPDATMSKNMVAIINNDDFASEDGLPIRLATSEQVKTANSRGIRKWLKDFLEDTRDKNVPKAAQFEITPIPVLSTGCEKALGEEGGQDGDGGE